MYTITRMKPFSLDKFKFSFLFTHEVSNCIITVATRHRAVIIGPRRKNCEKERQTDECITITK